MQESLQEEKQAYSLFFKLSGKIPQQKTFSKGFNTTLNNYISNSIMCFKKP